MSGDVWAVDYIMRAECKMRKDGKLTWLYVIKWRNNGNFSCLHLPGSDHIFERDPSLLKEFWDSTSLSSRAMRKDIVIVPPLSYKEMRQAITTTVLENDYDVQAEKCIPSKRKLSSPPFQDSASQIDQVSPTRLRKFGAQTAVVSDHSDGTDSLPDYEDLEDVPMQPVDHDNLRDESEDVMEQDGNDVIHSHNSISPQEGYGPPELGIDDDDLYAPIASQQLPDETSQHIDKHKGPVNALGDQEGTPFTTSETAHFSVNSAPKKSSESGKAITPLDGLSRESQRETPNLPTPHAPSNNFSVPIPGRERPGFTLALGTNTTVLPVELLDISSMFSNLFAAVSNVDVQGFYRHDDIMSKIGDWREGIKCETATLHLQDNAATKERQRLWKDLHQFLYDESMCLICFLPHASNALIIFSSQSKNFGETIGAHKGRMGFRSRIVACGVDISSRSIPFERQEYKADFVTIFP